MKRDSGRRPPPCAPIRSPSRRRFRQVLARQQENWRVGASDRAKRRTRGRALPLLSIHPVSLSYNSTNQFRSGGATFETRRVPERSGHVNTINPKKEAMVHASTRRFVKVA